ncbi:hypothetical protein C8024_11965 [Sphingopyxis sp. BSNA05]|uniref:2OG-Fe(II) oxygenase n=1 Tax=Sphingopyxis sp. BSNA05 TaxID=1236614 RepID=UPI001565181E|nr:2OG-Fe(II) oxygenase [Sphingopyxis sp. BSNA05]NRD90021.1 hypothetical protein [Sphingopyxis sp. BSNA05]
MKGQQFVVNVDNKLPVHIVWDKFLPDDQNRKCLDMFLEKETEFVASKVNHGQLDGERRRSKSYTTSSDVKSLLEAALQPTLPELFSGLRTGQPEKPKFEFQSVAHQDGDYYRVHIDTAMRQTGARRLISCVYYLHSHPKAFSGGHLRLYSINGKTHVDIEPQNNQIIFFPSFYPHEVLPTCVGSKLFAHSRFSIAGWINKHL